MSESVIWQNISEQTYSNAGMSQKASIIYKSLTPLY